VPADCGQDWDGPHRPVGRLLLGHTVRQRVVGPTGHYEDRGDCLVSRFIGSDPTKGSCSHGEVFEDLSGDVAFQASHDLETVEPLAPTPRHIGPCFCVVAHPGEDDPM
jgi:hypothetical protein